MILFAGSILQRLHPVSCGILGRLYGQEFANPFLRQLFQHRLREQCGVTAVGNLNTTHPVLFPAQQPGKTGLGCFSATGPKDRGLCQGAGVAGVEFFAALSRIIRLVFSPAK